jgi:hypothetical protein
MRPHQTFINHACAARLQAASVSASVTHTISTAVVMFELTGNMDYALPTLIAVVVAVLTSTRLTPSLYEDICKPVPQKRLPGFTHCFPRPLVITTKWLVGWSTFGCFLLLVDCGLLIAELPFLLRLISFVLLTMPNAAFLMFVVWCLVFGAGDVVMVVKT